MLDILAKLSEHLSGIRFDEAFTNAVSDYLGGEPDMDSEGNLYVHRKEHCSVLVITPFFTYPLAVDRIYEDGAIGLELHDARSLAFLPGSEVCVHGRRTYSGVIGSVPPHLQKGYCSTTPYELTDLKCDVGESCEVMRDNIFPGTRITFADAPCRLMGGKVLGRNLGLTAPAAALIRCIGKLAEDRFTICFCTNWYAALQRTDPDYVVVVDAIDIEHFKKEYTHGQGLGRIYIESGISVSPGIRDILKTAADAAGIDSGWLVRSDKHDEPHTLSWDIQTSMGGIPVGTIYLPYEGGSSGVQIMAGDAAEQTAKLLSGITAFPKRCELCLSI